MAHWMAEFAKWLPPERRPEPLKLYCIRDQKASLRNGLIKSWSTDGGVLLIGYEKLRAIVDRGDMNGCMRRGKKRKVCDTEPKNSKKKTTSNAEPDGSFDPLAEPVASGSGANAVADDTAAPDSTAGDPSDIDAARMILESGQIVICDEGKTRGGMPGNFFFQKNLPVTRQYSIRLLHRPSN